MMGARKPKKPRTRKIPHTAFSAAMGARIKSLRESAGISAYALAAAIGAAAPRVYGWESGEQCPGGENLCRVAKALGVSLAAFDALLDVVEEKTS